MTRQEYDKFTDDMIEAYPKFDGMPLACAVAEDLTLEDLTNISDMFVKKGFYSKFSFDFNSDNGHIMSIELTNIAESIAQAEKILESAGYICEVDGENKTWRQPEVL